MRKEGDKVLIGGVEYTLGKPIGGGLEGSVFNIAEGPLDKKPENHVIKIINDSSMTVSRRLEVENHIRKLVALRSKSELRKVMTLPKKSLDDELGYIMRKADGYESLNNFLNPPSDVEYGEWYNGTYSLKRRYQVIIDIFEALRNIHLNGLVFTDLSPNNIMVHTQNNGIVFIDTDNVRTVNDRYMGVLGTPRYMAPEIYRDVVPNEIGGIKVDESLLSRYGPISSDSDVFSAAVIAFELLTLHHPFVGDIIDDGTPEDEARAYRIETDYVFKEGTDNESTANFITVFDDFTTSELRRLFYRTFVDGKDNPMMRPSDLEFLQAFQTAFDMLVTCSECGYPRLFFEKQKNYCIVCNAPMEEHYALRIYSKFIKKSVAEGINASGINHDYDINDSYLIDENGNSPSDCFLLSSIILEPGVPKCLYHRNIEKVIDDSKTYAIFTLDTNCRNVSVVAFHPRLKKAVIISDRNSHQHLLGDSQKVMSLEHQIVLDWKPLKTGDINNEQRLIFKIERC